MLPTHVLWGMCVALPVLVLSPAHAEAALLAGALGGLFPDLDLYAGHRRTLHYPVYFPVTGALAVGVAMAAPSAGTIALAVFLVAAAVHSLADVLGGGLELCPWEATSERAVYDHRRGRWIPPRRWVPYDGAPADLLLAVWLAIPLLAVVEGSLRWIVGAALSVATAYAVVRRTLPTVAASVVSTLPAAVAERLPERYLDAEFGQG